MFKTKLRVIVFVSVALIITNALSVYFASSVKRVPNYIRIIISEKRKNIDLSEKDRKAYVAVVIEDELVDSEAKQHQDWAQNTISHKSQKQWEYVKTLNEFGHTVIVFKLVPLEEKQLSQ